MMPPFARSSETTVLARQPRQTNQDGFDYMFPLIAPREQHVLMILALISASISVASSTLAFYWFVKMRRSFRHEYKYMSIRFSEFVLTRSSLIMLLIQSDMLKALWFMVYPLVVFVNGPIRDESAFCQVSGFFLTVSIEQADVAVLIIAVHSALFIFYHQPFPKDEGLYPYRHTAYALWLIFPLTIAALAFVGGRNAYVAEGTYCYLRLRPFWYRLALDWIPRYIIIIVILGIYGSIYCYARRKFHGFRRDEIQIPKPTQWLRRPSSLPSTKPFACGALSPDSSAASKMKTEESNSITNSDNSRKSLADARRFSAQESLPLGWGSSILSSTNTVIDDSSLSLTLTPPPLQLLSPTLKPLNYNPTCDEIYVAAESRATSWMDSFRGYSPSFTKITSRKCSYVDIFNYLRRQPETNLPTSVSQPPCEFIDQTSAKAEIIATRDKIRRQLRFLFIYPLVYVGLWIVPFVTHIMQYERRYDLTPPFALTCVTTVCTCIQAAVDCWLFSTREKPWRHIPGSDGSFWGSLKFWTGWDSMKHIIPQAGPGRTRDEMVREARVAYQRRDDELAQRRNRIDAPGLKSEPHRKLPRSWWDVDGNGDLGTICPLEEEENLRLIERT